MEKGENAGYHHFLLIPQSFIKNFFPWGGNSGLLTKD